MSIIILILIPSLNTYIHYINYPLTYQSPNPLFHLFNPIIIIFYLRLFILSNVTLSIVIVYIIGDNPDLPKLTKKSDMLVKEMKKGLERKSTSRVSFVNCNLFR